MAEGADFRTLLRQVEAADSPLEKIRAVALAWRTLRHLSAKERADLATGMGLDEAGGLIERMAMRKGGLAPSLVLEAVRAAQKEDPSKLRRLVRGLGSSEGRKQAVVAGLQQMEERLAADGEAAETVFPEPEPEPEPDVEVETAAELEAIPPLPTEAEPPLAPEPGPRSAEPVEEPVAWPEVREAEPQPAEDVPPEPVAETPPEPAEKAPSEPPPAATPSPVPSDAAWSAADADLDAEANLTMRFRRLRELVDQGLPLGTEALATELEAFPPGWPRRRALTLLLRSGLAAGAADAIQLISGLESPAQRLWCAAALVDSISLTDAAFEQLLESVDHPTAHRRLRLRREAAVTV